MKCTEGLISRSVLQDHHGGTVKDVEGVAEAAVEHSPTAAGSLMVRLDAVDAPSRSLGCR